MYHSLYEGDDTNSIEVDDLPYAVSKENFIQQLDQLVAMRSGVFSGNTPVDVVITFDDGHQSNLDIAAPLLLERGLSAYFFITTGFINSKAGFLSTQGVRELADVPGMVVGSHGVTHQFFNDLTPSSARKELVDSKANLESITKHPCFSMSFPGGRYNKSTLNLLRSSGYTQWFGSDIGIVNVSDRFNSELVTNADQGNTLLPMLGDQPLERVAIRRTTQLDEFVRIITPDCDYYRLQKRRGRVKKLLQKTIGNRLYYGLYKSISTR